MEREQRNTGRKGHRRGSGVRVSSFDPLSLPSDRVSSPFHPCPCFDSKESLSRLSPTPRSETRARARPPARHVSPLSLSFTPTRRATWRATIAITSHSM